MRVLVSVFPVPIAGTECLEFLNRCVYFCFLAYIVTEFVLLRTSLIEFSESTVVCLIDVSMVQCFFNS